jgi:uncharacterized protein YjbI with pentapeptide repeats
MAQPIRQIIEALGDSPYEKHSFAVLTFTDELSGKEFDRCTFVDCNFIEANLTGCRFDACSFTSCNLSNPKVDNARFIDVEFANCKILGISFYKCSQSVFDFKFNECRLISCNFTDVNMKRCKFTKCDIVECYFQNTFLVEADFSESTFSQTLFHNSNLQKASFHNAYGYSLDPRSNNVKKAVFSVPEVLSLLDGFEIVIKSD